MPSKKGLYHKPAQRRAGVPTGGTSLEFKAGALQKAGKAGLAVLRREIKRSAWKREPGKLIRSFSVKTTANTVSIASSHPATKFLDEGARPFQMKHLRGKTVPIITDSGKIVYRKVTARSLANGKWVHPGHKARHLLRRGIEAAKKVLVKMLREEAVRLVLEEAKKR